MLQDLPAPIAAYVAANARLDADAMLAPFAPDAVVRDENRTRRGQAEIAAWIRQATLDARAVFTPDAQRREGRQIVVEGLTRGDFPSSPLRFTFRFQLADDAIAALEIA
jgi:ketosteroid isomerase-like protein